MFPLALAPAENFGSLKTPPVYVIILGLSDRVVPPNPAPAGCLIEAEPPYAVFELEVILHHRQSVVKSKSSD